VLPLKKVERKKKHNRARKTEFKVVITCNKAATRARKEEEKKKTHTFLHISIELVNEDGRLLAEYVVSDRKEHLLSLGVLNPAHGDVAVPGVEFATSLQLPQLDHVVSAGREQAFAVAARVHTPHRTFVSVIGTQTNAVACVPQRDGGALTGGEEQVAIVVECDRCDGSIMALQHVYLHDRVCVSGM
jgi:hypothetical protein